MPVSLSDSLQRRTAAIAVALLVAIVAIHVGSIRRHSLANNEFITLRVIKLDYPALIADRVGKNHMPGYFMIVKAWTDVFGKGEAALRMPSALFALAGIFVAWRLGAYLFGPVIGLFVLACAGLNQAHLQLSHDARMYSGLFFAMTLSLWALVRWLDGGGARWCVLQLAAGLLGVGLQLLYLFVPLCIVVYFAARWRSFQKRSLWFLAATLLPILIFMPVIMWWGNVQNKVGVMHWHGIRLVMLARSFVSPFFGYPRYLIEGGEKGVYNIFLLIALLAFTVWLARKRPSSNSEPGQPLSPYRYAGLLWLWCLLPTGLMAFAGLRSDENVILLWRYYVMIASAAPLLLAMGVRGLLDLKRPWLARAAAVYCLLVICTTTVGFMRWEGPGLREAAACIKKGIAPGDQVITSMTRRRTEAFLYYGAVETKPLQVPDAVTTPDAIRDWVEANSRGHERLWAVFYRAKKKDPLYKVLKACPDKFEPIGKVESCGETSVGLYKIKLSGSSVTTQTLTVGEQDKTGGDSNSEENDEN